MKPHNDLRNADKVVISMVLPDTVRDFGCIMGACEDNCCRNTTWTISIDEGSYKKYQALGGEVGQRILDCIDATGPVYVMKQFEDGKCPLMLDNGLCYVHKELGAEYLSQTCTTYPRGNCLFGNQIEFYLSLSCPEVVRHVLYRKKGISFVEERKVLAAPPPKGSFDTEKAMARDVLAKLISFRKLSLKEKLLYMGMFMRSLGRLNIYGDYERSFRKTVQNYQKNIKDARKSLGDVVAKLNVDEADARGAYLSMLGALSAHLATPVASHPVGIVNEEYYKIMGSFKDDMFEGRISYLCETFDRLIVPYVNANPFVFENYLMYSLMSTRFLSDTNNFAEAYAAFAGEFVTMLVFACMFRESETFGDEEMVAAIYLFHRRVSHSPVLRKKLGELFKDTALVFLVSALGGIK